MQEPIHHNSSHFAPISDAPSRAQAKVIAALAQGQTGTAAAEDAGVHRTTKQAQTIRPADGGDGLRYYPVTAQPLLDPSVWNPMHASAVLLVLGS